MPPKKKAPSKRGRARTEANLRAAMASGRSAAEEVIAFRSKQRSKRAAIEKKVPARRRGLGAPARVPAKARGLFGTSKSVGVLIAEGDSWFDYPMQDVIRLLEDDHVFDVESVAHKGDCVEDMAHSAGQFEEFARRLEKLLRDAKVPRAILLSGGGNDIAGDEFAILLNEASSTFVFRRTAKIVSSRSIRRFGHGDPWWCVMRSSLEGSRTFVARCFSM